MPLFASPILVLFLSLAVVLIASGWLTSGLERIGSRLRFSDALLGILMALGADSPEISSAFAALHSSYHDVGLGVVLGSSVFNLAGLLGLSAIVAGKVTVVRESLLLNGGVGLLVTIIVSVLIWGWLPPWLTVLVIATLVVPYVVVSSLRPATLLRLPVPRALKQFLFDAVGQLSRTSASQVVGRTLLIDALTVVLA